MKLNTRLITYLVVSLLAVIALQVSLLILFLNNLEQANHIRSLANQNKEETHRIEMALLKQSYSLKNLFIRGHDPTAYYLYLEEFFDSERKVYRSLETMKPSIKDDPTLLESYNELMKGILSSSTDYRAAIEAYSESNTDAHLVADRYTSIENLILEDLLRFSNLIGQHSQDQIEQLNHDIEQGIAFLLVSTIGGGLLLLVALIWYFKTRFINPLEKAIHTASAVSQGNKDQRMEVSKHHINPQEFDIFALAFNEMLDNLEQKNQELKQAMIQLSTAEKLSSLGSLVAGVAHELNTPIGVALTGSSCLGDRADEIEHAIKEDRLTKQKLVEFLSDIRTGSRLIVNNIKVASELIHNFKQVAVDQSSERRREFNVKVTLVEVLSTLSPTIKKTPHTVHLNIEPHIVIDSFPGPLGQVITNLINNSLIHGFDGKEQGNIWIEAYSRGHTIQLTYRDDGKGIPKEIQSRVFEPFFTTRMGQGGSGLGMHIVHNIVTGILKGHLTLESDAYQGVKITMELPLSVDPKTNKESMVK